MNKKIISIAIVIIIIIATLYFAGWLIFHKPEYRGRIIEADTKKPIEGAVIVAMYSVDYYIGGPAGSNPELIHVRETLTNEKGEFVIPSYTTLMSPISYELGTDFIIYKEGYGSYPQNRKDISSFQYYGPAYIFKNKMDTQEEIYKDSKVVIITFGVAELPRLHTREERIRAIYSLPDEWEKTPILLNAINDEYTRIGLEPIGPTGK